MLTARQSAGFGPARAAGRGGGASRHARHARLHGRNGRPRGTKSTACGTTAHRSIAKPATPMLEVFKGLAAPEDRRPPLEAVGQVRHAEREGPIRHASSAARERRPASAWCCSSIRRKASFNRSKTWACAPRCRNRSRAVARHGLFVFSAVPGGGLTTTIDWCCRTSIGTCEISWPSSEDRKPEREIENVHVTTYSTAAGETPAGLLPKLIRTYPDVIIVRNVAEVETLDNSLRAGGREPPVGHQHARQGSGRGARAVDDAQDSASRHSPPAVTAVLNLRLVRKLCEKCKEAYPPPPEVLKQLGLPAGKVETSIAPQPSRSIPRSPTWCATSAKETDTSDARAFSSC